MNKEVKSLPNGDFEILPKSAETSLSDEERRAEMQCVFEKRVAANQAGQTNDVVRGQ